MKSGKIVLGLLAGVAIGSLLGIMLAPDKGSSTRKKLTRKLSQKREDLTDELSDKFNEVVGDITNKFESVKKEVKKMAENGMNAVK
jgi:gas vesicle protein